MTPRDAPPRLIALTDRSVASPEQTLRRFELVARAAQPFSVMFQLRDRELPLPERLAFGRELRALCTREQQWFQVNDRCDLAVLLDADALHLGEASIAATDARRLVGVSMFVSRACHAPLRELEPDVDAWVLSPIFGERKGRAALGVEGLSKLVDRCRSASSGLGTPTVYALGAITAENAARAVACGAGGVVALGAVLAAEKPERLVRALAIARPL